MDKIFLATWGPLWELQNTGLFKIMKDLDREISSRTKYDVSLIDIESKLGIDKFIEKGWTYLVDSNEVYYLNTDYQNDVDNFVMNYYEKNNYQFLSNLLSNFQASIPPEYQVALEQASKAFLAELYYPCASCLSALFDGLLTFYSKNQTTKFTIRNNDISEKLNMYKFGVLIWYSLESFIINHYAKNSEGFKYEPKIINRHFLLHGRMSRNVTKKDCLQIFNAIQTFLFICHNFANQSEQ